jgi:acetate kinase
VAFLGVAIDGQRNDIFHGDGTGADATGRDGAGHDGTGDSAAGARGGPASADADITGAGATVRTLVITAREDLQIAREARELLATP